MLIFTLNHFVEAYPHKMSDEKSSWFGKKSLSQNSFPLCERINLMVLWNWVWIMETKYLTRDEVFDFNFMRYTQQKQDLSSTTVKKYL